MLPPLYVMVIQILGHQYVVLVFHQYVVEVLLMEIALEKQICPVYNGQGHFFFPRKGTLEIHPK